MSIYILSGARTPSGSFMGQFLNTSVSELGAASIVGAVKRTQINLEDIDEVYMGNVISSGVGQAPARQASLAAKIPKSVPCTTVSKVCGSGMKSIIMGMQSIGCGDNQLVLAGGMENMSRAPHLLVDSRKGHKFGETKLIDSMQYDGLTDAYQHVPMGNFAEKCVSKYGFSRADMDSFAIESFKRAQDAVKQGHFAREIEPVTVTIKRNEIECSTDESPFSADFEKIPKLRPAFLKDGSITAANASSINDGAAAVILAGEKYKDLAKFKILAHASYAGEPEWFTTAPAMAMSRCLEKSDLVMDKIDLFEINEAFAVVTMATMKELNISHEKVNIFGGGVSLGHPIGCSGSRIVVTLMNALESKNAKYGMASICIGGGEALSLLIERL